MRLAIVGIRGIPNNYGGFETLAEYLVQNLSHDFEITVYCSSIDMKIKQKKYYGANLKYVPISSHGAYGILYDSISFIHAVLTNDKILFLGFGGGFVAPLLKKFKRKIILNFGGLDWKRNKWSAFSRMVIKKAESNLVKNCSLVVADNIGIQNYIKNEYNIDAPLIAYGGDQALKQEVSDELKKRYNFLNGVYAFTVARIQSDNNIEMILEAFNYIENIPLVIVGNWTNSSYGIKIKNKFINKKNIYLLEAIYDRTELDALRSNCSLYIHGHSAGGTNPSLVEAMFLGLNIFAFSSGYNEYTTFNEAKYFKSVDELISLVNNSKNINSDFGLKLKEIAFLNYKWAKIAEEYKNLILKN